MKAVLSSEDAGTLNHILDEFRSMDNTAIRKG